MTLEQLGIIKKKYEEGYTLAVIAELVGKSINCIHYTKNKHNYKRLKP